MKLAISRIKQWNLLQISQTLEKIKYYEYSYANKIDYLDEMDKFLENHN